ncbi:MAG: NADP-dependent phosphogluconate dehydrogenase [bacterium]
MKIAISGLGKMGSQIAVMLSENGHEVLAHDANPETVKKAASKGLKAFSDPVELVHAFGTDRIIIWLMIPAEFVTEALNTWLSLLQPGDIIIDGGNSDYRQTIIHSQKAGSMQVNFLDIGTSGGILGLKNGFSMMVGGDEETFKFCEPVIKVLSLPNGSYKHFGATGAGHFIKMVHNAIEYGAMESLAEGYRLIKDGPYQHVNLANVAAVWQKGSIIKSDLNELAYEIFKENPNLDEIDGVVAESGEARWAIESARTQGFDMPAIKASRQVRLESNQGQINFGTKLLAALRNKFGGHAINK